MQAHLRFHYVLFHVKRNKTESSVSSDTLATVMPKDSVTTQKQIQRQLQLLLLLIMLLPKKRGKYPHDIKFFEDKGISERLKKLTGAQYDEMVKNFNVESPIASENGIYKLTGCKQHDCPGYATSIYYDAKNDNLNISIDKTVKATEFAEKEKLLFQNRLNQITEKE